MNRFLFSLGLSVLLVATPAMARRVAQPGPMDSRIQTVVYNPRDVVQVRGHYGYILTIAFAADEAIQTFALGDSVAWQVTPNKRGNLLFLKPVEPHAVTNLTVVTSRRLYTFDLRSSTAKSSLIPTYKISFVYPEEDQARILAAAAKQEAETAVDVPPASAGPQIGVEGWNFRYTYTGTKTNVPLRVFDDGKFTYFQFADLTSTPAIFTVDSKRNEGLVNYAIKGPYVVVQRIARQFTLRNGADVTCIFNEAMPIPSLDINSPQPRTAARDEKAKP
jgi:type IV secretion system protein VirB9